MQFIDEVKIKVIAGKGGDGIVSFRREKFIPRGGPNGGDGGDGGSVILVSDARVNTLLDYKFVREYKAENGRAGQGNNRTGKSGNNLYLKVPVGTSVFNEDLQLQVADLINNHQEFIAARGGEHGLGNTHFKSSTNQTPRKYTQGSSGEDFNLKLELKLLADVGLLGLPNAGKSSFIGKVCNARSKVGDYPFTTLKPILGVIKLLNKHIVIADIPGIISGASQGKGLGISFLKHISRNKLLLHLVEVDAYETVINNINIITKELQGFNTSLLNKPRWLVLTKVDLLFKSDLEKLQYNLQKDFHFDRIFAISNFSGVGIENLLSSLSNDLNG